MLAIMVGSGAFLFALMSAFEPAFKVGTGSRLDRKVRRFCYCCSEIYTMTKYRSKLRMQSQLERSFRVIAEERIDSCARIYKAATFL